MRRLILPALFVVIGFILGVSFERWQMRVECANGTGDWTGTICVNSDLLQ